MEAKYSFSILEHIITAKISVVQDLIATLTLRPERADPSQPSAEKDSLIRSRSGHLSQITILTRKFDSEYDNFLNSLEEVERSDLLIVFDFSKCIKTPIVRLI